MKKIVTVIVSLLLVVGLLVKAKSLLSTRVKEKESQKTPSNMRLSIELTKPKEGKMSERVDTFAKLDSGESITISTKLAGFIQEIPFVEAQKFKKGDILVKIDSQEIRSSLSSLKSLLEVKRSSLEYAKEVYKRNKNLYSVGGLPKEQLDKSMIELKSQEAGVKSTKEQISQLENRLEYLSIKAPFDGVVDRVLLHLGDMAGAGKPILKVSNHSQKIIFSFVPELLSKLKAGNLVYLKGKKEPIGEVKSIYPSSNLSLAQGEIKLYSPLNLPTGVNFDVQIELKNLKGCIINNQNILYKRDGAYIALYKDKKFTLKRITPLIENRDRVLIQSCPEYPIAKASTSKLSTILSYKDVVVVGESK